MDRREFLKALGISGAVTLSGCERLPVRHALPYLIPPEEITPGVPAHYATTCLACPAACGMVATVREGRPVKLEGRPDNAASAGGLCALGQGHLRGLYDAGRLRRPTIDDGTATWDEIDAAVRRGLDKAKDAGTGVWLVTEPTSGPTGRATMAAFVQQFGGRHVQWEAAPAGAAATQKAYELLDGRAILPSLDLDKADLLICLGSDFLTTGPAPVANTAGYAARRRAREQGREFRHVQVEGNLTLTGAAADERMRATAAERGAIARGLLAKGGGGDPRVAKLAALLGKHKGRALVISGSDDIGEQVAVAMVNRRFGAEGGALRPDLPLRVAPAGAPVLDDLLKDAAAGRVGAAIFMGVNPVETWASGPALAEALKKIPLAVTLTDRPTGTAAACSVVAAAHHALERWADAAPRPDVLTLAQPAIRPLFGTRDPMDSLLRWTGVGVTYREHLQGVWSRRVLAGLGSNSWREAVAAGGVDAAHAAKARFEQPAAGQPNVAAANALIGQAAPDSKGLEVELITEVGVRDGRSGFNPWLRELPEPLTRSAWVATARVAPETAKAKGLGDGDLVDLKVGDATVRLPVRVQVGQHPDVIGVPVGYGQKDGDGGAIERNAFRLAAGGRTAGLSATLASAGKAQPLPLMQWHSSAEERPIVHQLEHIDDAVPAGHHGAPKSLWTDRTYSPHWQMVIDLDACTGCGACVIACQAENNIPVVGPEEMRLHKDMYWLRIDRYYLGEGDNPDVMLQPMTCAQCDNAPCETVCPAAATVHSADGLNQQVYNRCVGTRYCANNCPYKVRRFNWVDYPPKDPIERLVLNPDVVVRERGIMEKCTFCVQRIQLSRIEAKNAGDTGPLQVRTACQQSCAAGAIRFGDGAQEHGEIAELMHKPRAFQALAEIGVLPSITYLAQVRNRAGAAGNGSHDSHGEET